MARGSYTEWEFRREVLTASASLTTIGPLRLKVARELARRRIYFGIIWSGFTDWNAEGELTLVEGSSPVCVMRQRWGNNYSYGASSSGWGGSSQTWRASTGGLPAYSVEAYDPGLNPNWGLNPASADALTIASVQRPSGTTPNVGYRLTMFPWEFIGPLDEIRFEFETYPALTTTDSLPSVEVFIGCKSTSV